jgi:hypothetical protein
VVGLRRFLVMTSDNTQQPVYNCVRYAVLESLDQGSMEGFRTLVRDELRYNNVPPAITFTKADGTERRMICTTNASLIPQNVDQKETRSGSMTPSRKQSDNTQPVYDIETSGWRSFVWTRIKSIEYHDPWPDQTRQEFDKNPPF